MYKHMEGETLNIMPLASAVAYGGIKNYSYTDVGIHISLYMPSYKLPFDILQSFQTKPSK